MSAESDSVAEFAERIASLYEQIILEDIPEEPSYRGFLERETEFALDDQGYRVSCTSRHRGFPRASGLPRAPGKGG